jgi:methyl-accepting chemotaxis protein
MSNTNHDDKPKEEIKLKMENKKDGDDVTDKVSKLRHSAEQSLENIKNTAESVKEYSLLIQETAKAVRESGAIPEFVKAIREVSSMIYELSKEIREGVKEKESENGDDVVDKAKSLAKDTIQSAKKQLKS